MRNDQIKKNGKRKKTLRKIDVCKERESQQIQFTTVVLETQANPSTDQTRPSLPPTKTLLLPLVGVTDLYNWATPETADRQHQHK